MLDLKKPFRPNCKSQHELKANLCHKWLEHKSWKSIDTRWTYLDIFECRVNFRRTGVTRQVDQLAEAACTQWFAAFNKTAHASEIPRPFVSASLSALRQTLSSMRQLQRYMFRWRSFVSRLAECNLSFSWCEASFFVLFSGDCQALLKTKLVGHREFHTSIVCA